MKYLLILTYVHSVSLVIYVLWYISYLKVPTEMWLSLKYNPIAYTHTTAILESVQNTWLWASIDSLSLSIIWKTNNLVISGDFSWGRRIPGARTWTFRPVSLSQALLRGCNKRQNVCCASESHRPSLVPSLGECGLRIPRAALYLQRLFISISLGTDIRQVHIKELIGVSLRGDYFL